MALFDKNKEIETEIENKKRVRKYAVSKEVAEESFEDFCFDWDIDPDIMDLNEEEKADFNGQKSKIVKAIMQGRLIYDNDAGIFKYLISDNTDKSKINGKTEITLKRPIGRTLRQSDRVKEGKNVEKTYMILASMLGDDMNLVDNLDMIDLKPLLAVSSLFLAS